MRDEHFAARQRQVQQHDALVHARAAPRQQHAVAPDDEQRALRQLGRVVQVDDVDDVPDDLLELVHERHVPERLRRGFGARADLLGEHEAELVAGERVAVEHERERLLLVHRQQRPEQQARVGVDVHEQPRLGAKQHGEIDR